MFKNNVLLNPRSHQNMTLSPTTDWRFAAGETLVALTLDEIVDAARDYPILFFEGADLPFALMGVVKGHNAYIDGNGRWCASYVPARFRAYPFALAEAPGKQGAYALAYDAEAYQLLDPNGQKLFEAGKPAGVLQARVRLLEAMRKADAATRSVVQAIREAGLLSPRKISVQHPDGSKGGIRGVEMIDDAKLAQLSGEGLLDLREKGALPLIYAHLFAFRNFRRPPLNAKL